VSIEILGFARWAFLVLIVLSLVDLGIARPGRGADKALLVLTIGVRECGVKAGRRLAPLAVPTGFAY